MNIVVCVKYVPDAQSDRTFEADNTVDRVGVDGLLSELDEYAVEQALQIKEAAEGDVEVTVLTVGPEQAADAIRKALQMGADKGVHVSDEAIAGSDALATSLVLAEAIGKIGGPDLVLSGMASTDGSMSVVPAMLAERLGLPQVTFASELDRRGRQVTDPPRRRRRDRDRAGLAAGAGVGDRPVQRAALPLVQGDHGGQEEAARDAGRWPTSASTPSSSASRRRGPGWTPSPQRPAAHAGEIVTDEGEGGTKLAEFLAAKKFI